MIKGDNWYKCFSAEFTLQLLTSLWLGFIPISDLDSTWNYVWEAYCWQVKCHRRLGVRWKATKMANKYMLEAVFQGFRRRRLLKVTICFSSDSPPGHCLGYFRNITVQQPCRLIIHLTELYEPLIVLNVNDFCIWSLSSSFRVSAKMHSYNHLCTDYLCALGYFRICFYILMDGTWRVELK